MPTLLEQQRRRERQLDQREFESRQALEAVAARLRASRERLEDAQYQAGYQAGSRWGKESAEYAELVNLQKAARELEDLIGTPAETQPWERLYLQIHPESVFWPPSDLSIHALASEWFVAILGSNWAPHVASPEFLIGFVQGALAVWTEVSLHVESGQP